MSKKKVLLMKSEELLAGKMLVTGRVGRRCPAQNDQTGIFRTLWDAADIIRSKGGIVDIVSVATYLEQRGELPKCGGRLYLVDLCQNWNDWIGENTTHKPTARLTPDRVDFTCDCGKNWVIREPE